MQSLGVFLDPPTIACEEGRWKVTLSEEMRAAVHDLDDDDDDDDDDDALFSPDGTRDALFDFGTSDDEGGGVGICGGGGRSKSKLAQAYERYLLDRLFPSAPRTEEGLLYATTSTVAVASGKSGDSDEDYGCLLIEPVLVGAGGMLMPDPLFQRTLVRLCKAMGVPVVYDEVFAGLYRCLSCLVLSRLVLSFPVLSFAMPTSLLPPTHSTNRLGAESARDLLGPGCNPDVSCFAKLLTGGAMPLSATLASDEVSLCSRWIPSHPTLHTKSMRTYCTLHNTGIPLVRRRRQG